MFQGEATKKIKLVLASYEIEPKTFLSPVLVMQFTSRIAWFHCLVNAVGPLSGVARLISVSSCDAGEANIEMVCILLGRLISLWKPLEAPWEN